MKRFERNLLPAAALLGAALFILAGVDAAGQESKPAKSGKASDDAKKKDEKKDEKWTDRPPGTELTDVAKKAEDFNNQAVKLFKQGKYQEALNLFKQVDEIAPNPITKFNIGRCYDKLGSYKKAYEMYQKYIQSGHKLKLVEAKDAVAKIEQMPLKLIVKASPEDAEIYVDGSRLESKDGSAAVEVSPGPHMIGVKKEGYDPVEKEIKILWGGYEVVKVQLVKLSDMALTKSRLKKSVVLVGESGKPGEKKKLDSSICVGLAAGMTVSTSKMVTSYVDVNLHVSYRIKYFFVGLGINNLIFNNSYIFAGYPEAGFVLKAGKLVSLSFAAGFGAAVLAILSDSVAEEGFGGSKTMWDLVVHADAKVRIKLGPVLLQLVPLYGDVFVGAGSVPTAPLVQFAFLVGVAYGF